MFKTIKSKLFLLTILGFLAVAISVSVSYLIAVREIKTIMQTDIGAVADALEKSISYIAAVRPDAYKDNDFKKFIYSVKIGKSGYAYMLDDQGTLVVHYKEEGKNLAGQPHIDHIRSHRESGYYEYTAQTTGQDKIVAYRYIRPWGLWIVPGVNKADYFDQLKVTFLKWNLMCGIVIIILLSLASSLIIRGITAPVQEAVKVADRLATGDLSLDFTEGRIASGGGELGILTAAQKTMVTGLNSMVARINATSGELSGISDTISGSALRVTAAAGNQAAAVTEATSSVDAIQASVQEVARGVDGLSLSAAETSSMTLEMSASVEEVTMNVGSLAAAAEEVSSSVMEMSAAVKQIGTSVQGLMDVSSMTVSSITEMESAIKQIQENATTTAEISRDVLQDAEAGRDSVRATIAGIDEIRRAASLTAEVINALSASAADIGDILGVIDNVTGKTNLLALNASIIAAQAGEHGKGFAVVAGEIKQLADQTRNSTREIGAVISGVLVKTGLAVKTIDEAEQSIAAGSKLSRQSEGALEKIVDRVKNSSDQVGEIARATVEQAKGSQMISKAMGNMAEMVVQIRNATREQERGNELIMTAVERMNEMTARVNTSTREHNSAIRGIARSTENITTMVEQIRQACIEQHSCGGRIAESMTLISRAADDNLQATGNMNEAVAGLGKQVEVLKREMSSFRTG